MVAPGGLLGTESVCLEECTKRKIIKNTQEAPLVSRDTLRYTVESAGLSDIVKSLVIESRHMDLDKRS